MSSNKEQNFLQEVVRQINFPFDRKSIYKELSGHIEEAKEEYLDQHLDADEASRCALDDMGIQRKSASHSTRFTVRSGVGYGSFRNTR